jgi:hypothetical protein
MWDDFRPILLGLELDEGYKGKGPPSGSWWNIYDYPRVYAKVITEVNPNLMDFFLSF